MGQHDPLGRTGGAGGVDEVAAEVRAHLLQPLLQGRVAQGLPQVQQLLPRHHLQTQDQRVTFDTYDILYTFDTSVTLSLLSLLSLLYVMVMYVMAYSLVNAKK